MLSSKAKKPVSRYPPFLFLQEPNFVVRRSKECSPNSQSWFFTYHGPILVASDHQVSLSKSGTMEGGSYLSGKEKEKASYE